MHQNGKYPAPKRGILLVNLGSPDSTSVPDVRRYLREFLMDARVIDAPYPVRKMIVELFILPFRPKASAHAYQQIWWEQGSPLVVLSERVQEMLQQKTDLPVALAMRSAMARPSPVPSFRVVKNGSKIAIGSSAEIPAPLSST